MIGAQEAVQIGLANLMVKPEELMDQALKVARKIATKGPLAVRAALSAVQYGLETDLETGLLLESALGNLAIASNDKEEGIAAFFEKRKPEFHGC
jgi:enoyl-CoA hydratase